MEAIPSLQTGQTMAGEPERRGGERSEVPRSGGSPAIVRDAAATLSMAPDPEVMARRARRRFTTAYKLEILRKADACTQPGQFGALLRKEGLYSSHVVTWRRQREAGLTPKKRGRPVTTDPRVKQLEREKAGLEATTRRLERRLLRAETIIAFQKNHPARLSPHYLLDQKLSVRLRCDHPGGSGRLLFGDAVANP